MPSMHRLFATLSMLIVLAAPALAQPPVAKPAPAQKRLQSPLPTGPTADQCRATCAQDYYFCLSGNEPQDCSPRWAQCRAACSR